MPDLKKRIAPEYRWLPHPLMTLTLLIIWLLLMNTISFAHILLGTFLGTIIPWFTNRFWPERPQISNPVLLLRFFFSPFLFDIIVANITVVRLMLQPDISKLTPGFIQIPLDTDDPMVISILASVISLTPGTVSSEVYLKERLLIVHSIDVPDPEAAVQTIKTRYEKPLKEIFLC
ncbi:MAG: Na+/H+ antiporter subunit E [Proteobacteria bacterium]|nr:Na+/H+ antiporter subunit E [Pseudomonadota bacterium]MBU1388613.1 Na+/H+ antiporter subunit E [Pseudomonadota bacterium]MBU1541769.1 Na+/H+ antiporter subunit E [Pseudomonadota bacterium]MBU2430419.1 Na+/H+ antiporter subunit E [Pseudomonadota bacterium]MBU2482331.1 Na+/H+ antiporter subunit E [Pseudomonadota bacterium]